jgi:hypothetical protein
MNEVELIRAQLSAERRHATQVANACADTKTASAGAPASASELDEFCRACVDYLVWVLSRFEERDQILSDLIHSRLAADDEIHRELHAILSRPGTSREALARLEAALTSTTATQTPGNVPERNWHEFAQFFNGAWSARREELDNAFERNARVADWRAISGIDADAILEERTRYARVTAKLPAGIELRA